LLAYTFGVSQISQEVGLPPLLLAPFTVARDVHQGDRVTFAPVERVVLYFTRNTHPGTVTPPSGESITVVLKPGLFPTFSFDGTWNEPRPAAKPLALAESIDPVYPIFLFRVVLAGPLSLSAIQRYFADLLPGSKVKVTRALSIPEAAIYELTVFGPNPWSKLEGVIGKEIDELIKQPIIAGYYKLHGRGAVIESIIPANTPESVLWNAVFKHAAK